LAELGRPAGDPIRAGKLWQASGLSLTEFVVAKDDIQAFISNYKLAYLDSADGATNPTSGGAAMAPTATSSGGGFNAESFGDQLAKRLQSSGHDPANRTSVTNWVIREVKDLSNPAFLRTLINKVVEAALDGLGGPYSEIKLREERFSSYCTDILGKLVDGKEAELEVLFAVQALMHRLEYPSQLLPQLFGNLYLNDVILPETFTAWKADKSPAHQQGKGVAVTSSTQFFVQLNENEDGDQDDID